MYRIAWRRFLPLWVAFSVGLGAGAWLGSRHGGLCQAQVYDVDTDAFTAAIQTATVTATTGSGWVTFDLGPGSIHVHAESAFANRDFDQTLPALVRGSTMKVNVSSRLLARLSGR